MLILGLLFAWESWECLSEAEVSVNSLMWKSVEFVLVSFKLGDEINKVFWLLELLEVLSINNITEFIFNLDD